MGSMTLNESESTSFDTDVVSTKGAEKVTGVRLPYLTITSITIICFLMLLDVSIISTATPSITNEFRTIADVGWYSSAYPLASAALQPLTGKFYQKFSVKWTFLVFVFIFELGSFLSGVAASSKILIVGRAISGMGASGILNGAFTIIASCVPIERRPAMTGLILGISQLGTLAGPLIGGAFTQNVSWRWCFYINLPLGCAAAALLIPQRIPEHVPKATSRSAVIEALKNLDLVGFVLFAPAAVLYMLALQFGGNKFAWNSPTIIGLFCGAAVIFVAFLIWEYREGNDAMIPFPMVRIQTVWSSCVVYGFMLAFSLVNSFYLPIYFQAVKGVSPVTSGVYLLPSILSQTIIAVISGDLVQYTGYYLPWCVFGNALAIAANALFSTFSPSTSTGKWIGCQILVGVGRGIAMQMPITAVQNKLSMEQIPTGMAILMFCQAFFGSNLLAYAELVFTTSLKSAMAQTGVDYESVISTGITAFRKVVPSEQLAGVLSAYAKSIDHVFYLTTCAAGAAFLFSFAMGFTDIRRVKKVEANADDDDDVALVYEGKSEGKSDI